MITVLSAWLIAVWSAPLSEKCGLAADAHEGSTGGVRLQIWAATCGRSGREQRLEAWAQEHESIWRSEPCLTALQILELHPPVKRRKEGGTFYTRHKSTSVWIFRLSGQEGQCISRPKKQQLDSGFALIFFFSKAENKWNEKKMKCGKSEDINNDPEVSRCLNVPTITLDNSCHAQYI